MAVMFITHDMGVVAEIADEIVVMRYGKLVERGRRRHDLRARRSTPTPRMLLQRGQPDLDRPSDRRLAMRAANAPGARRSCGRDAEQGLPSSSGLFGAQKSIAAAVAEST